MVYTRSVIEIIKSATFDAWLHGLRDRVARAKIQARITRMALGNPGDVAPVGHGVSEMRIHYGPAYRVDYMQHRPALVLLLNGGYKDTQAADIKRAHTIAKDWKE